MSADVFNALDETEFGFMREKLEAEFNSGLPFFLIADIVALYSSGVCRMLIR